MLVRDTVLNIECVICENNFKIKVHKKGYKKYLERNYINLKNIFPYLTYDEIELIETDTCKECF